MQYDELAQAQQGQTPDQLAQAAQAATQPYQAPQLPPPMGDFNVQAPDRISSSVLSTNVTNGDLIKTIKDNIANRNAMIQNYASALKPSQEETNLTQQYNDYGNQINQINLDTQNKQQAFEVNPEATTGFVTRQQAETGRQAQYKTSSLALQQQAVADKLKLAQSQRQSQMDALKFQIDAGNGDNNTLMQLAQLQRQEEQDVVTRMDKLTDNARQTVQTLLTNFGGLAFEDLTPQTQAQVQQLARAAGIPEGLLREGMKTIKDRQLIEQQQKNAAALEQQKFNNELDMMKYQLQVYKANGGGGGSSSGLLDAVIENPALYKTLTPSQRAKILPDLRAAGVDLTSLTDQPLTDEAVKQLTQTQSAISNLNDLKGLIESNSDKLGPITGLQKYNPWSDAKKVQADIDRVKQQVGKALEGGVLRKEYEDKYKQILATLTDTPSTAIYKVNSLISSLQRDLDNYNKTQDANGKRVPTSTASSPDELRNKYKY